MGGALSYNELADQVGLFAHAFKCPFFGFLTEEATSSAGSTTLTVGRGLLWLGGWYPTILPVTMGRIAAAAAIGLYGVVSAGFATFLMITSITLDATNPDVPAAVRDSTIATSLSAVVKECNYILFYFKYDPTSSTPDQKAQMDIAMKVMTGVQVGLAILAYMFYEQLWDDVGQGFVDMYEGTEQAVEDATAKWAQSHVAYANPAHGRRNVALLARGHDDDAV